MRIALFFLFIFFTIAAFAGDTARLYHPQADAKADVARLLAEARAQNKKLLVQVGGNWCVPCYRLNALLQTDTSLKQLLDENFMVYHLNYSRENRNAAYLQSIGDPQRFGVPALLVLDEKGKVLELKKPASMQKGNGFDAYLIKAFLTGWKQQKSN